MLLPLNFNSREAEQELQDIVKNLPPEVEAYLVGGSLRNALYRCFHGEVLRQRDYDIVCTKGFNVFLDNLKTRGFYDEGKIIKTDQVVMIKPVVADFDVSNLEHFLAFDTHPSQSGDIRRDLENNASLLINGNAINLRNLYDKNWKEKLVSLPDAVSCIENKQIRINKHALEFESVGFFSVIRFVSVGFAPPPQDELDILLKNLKHKDKFEKTVHKVWDYVGGEQKAREIVRKLGIEIDVFNKKVVDSL